MNLLSISNDYLEELENEILSIQRNPESSVILKKVNPKKNWWFTIRDFKNDEEVLESIEKYIKLKKESIEKSIKDLSEDLKKKYKDLRKIRELLTESKEIVVSKEFKKDMIFNSMTDISVSRVGLPKGQNVIFFYCNFFLYEHYFTKHLKEFELNKSLKIHFSNPFIPQEFKERILNEVYEKLFDVLFNDFNNIRFKKFELIEDYIDKFIDFNQDNKIVYKLLISYKNIRNYSDLIDKIKNRYKSINKRLSDFQDKITFVAREKEKEREIEQIYLDSLTLEEKGMQEVENYFQKANVLKDSLQDINLVLEEISTTKNILRGGEELESII